MAVVIRFKRAGAKGRPFYRVVVADSRYPRDGRFIEQLGYYDPLTKPSTFQVDTEKFAKWVRHGAQPSESVAVMVAKIAPEALRPPRLAPAASAAEAAPAKKPAKKKAAATTKKVARKKAATKGSEKKAKARAKAKATKGGAAKKKAAKKPKA